MQRRTNARRRGVAARPRSLQNAPAALQKPRQHPRGDTMNQITPNAIVSRSKTALDRLDGRPLGDPGNVVISEDRKTAYVVNHHGAIDNAEFLQHGGRGNIAVMDIGKMTKPKHDDTADALE